MRTHLSILSKQYAILLAENTKMRTHLGILRTHLSILSKQLGIVRRQLGVLIKQSAATSHK
jgi:hypothetical protein